MIYQISVEPLSSKVGDNKIGELLITRSTGAVF